MTRKLFGTDGIRGQANQGFMTPELAFRVGAAMTYQAKQASGKAPRIVIGKDTRLSGYLLETSLASGICALGGQVLLSGPIPTPAIAYLTRSMRADVGIVISASHNPYQDNGIKIFGPDGFKLPDEKEAEIERMIESNEIDHGRPTGPQIGRAERIEDATGRYITYAKNSFPSDLSLEGLKIVVDAGHGAAYQCAPAVFEELGATVYCIGTRPDGKNINRNTGALHPETCAREVKRRSAHIGIALDGDADRVIIVDEKGKVVDGDSIMAICAKHMLKLKKLKKRTLVTTYMSNIGLDRAIADANGKLLRCNVGDRHVVAAMRKHGYNFGGEQSGHLIFLDHSTTGDGIVAALQLLSVLLFEEKNLSVLAKESMQRTPQVLLNVNFAKRKPISEMKRLQKSIKDAQQKLNKDGRVFVRWSGTEAKLRILVEGPDKSMIGTLAKKMAEEAEFDLL